MTTNSARPRGRPRRFDVDHAVATAQRLFHSRGYDAVSVSDVTNALGINAPSFYAAFGSKAGLYSRALNRYAGDGAIPFSTILRDDRPVSEALAELLEEAARRYAGSDDATGCLVLEGTRCNDLEARDAARAFNIAAEDVLRAYVSARHPAAARSVTDFVSTTMSGLSAKARQGHSLERLLESARVAGVAVKLALDA